jgi:plasmid segregation protein ParM
MKKIVRALDLGWGYTKYSLLDSMTQEIEYKAFPSLAPRHTGMDLSLGILGGRDTVVVDVDGTQYEVGPDSVDLDSSDASRNLNDAYIHTEQYKALFFGALAYMKEPVIDLLVVGLPLSNMQAAPKLRELMVGKHRINAQVLVEVRDALVVPQPLGGLYHCLGLKDSLEALAFMDEEANLIIDPGFLTFDFLFANGTRVVENRSGAHNGGVSKVLRAIAESLSAKFGIRYENLNAIDRALRRRKIRINGEVEALEEHIRSTRGILEAPVNYMRNLVGDGSDIDNIILLGGGSVIFKSTIERFYPKHDIILVEDSQLANVRGFQRIGEQQAAAKKTA